MGADDPAVVKPYCQLDHEQNGREWAGEVPYRTRTEVQEMATHCGGCPVIQECSRRAQRMERDDGPGTVAGVWGGEYYRDGLVLDPWGPESGDMRSIYRYVWFDRDRGTWRAEVVRDGRRQYLASSKSEDKAGAAAWGWRLDNEED